MLLPATRALLHGEVELLEQEVVMSFRPQPMLSSASTPSPDYLLSVSIRGSISSFVALARRAARFLPQ
jgi:hypothetical protein